MRSFHAVEIRNKCICPIGRIRRIGRIRERSLPVLSGGLREARCCHPDLARG